MGVSEEQLLDLVLHFLDFGVEAGFGVAEDGASNDVPGHAAGTSEVGLLGNVHVGHILK